MGSSQVDLMKYAAFLMLTLLIVSEGRALSSIDPRNGNFSESVVDLATNGPESIFSVRRVYNSRSKHTGIFGKGWCSNFEMQLDTSQKTIGVIVLSSCDIDGKEYFFPAPAGEKAFNSERGVLKESRQGWALTRIGGERLSFDTMGTLISLRDADGTDIKLEYGAEKKLKAVRHKNGEALSFVRDNQGNLNEVRGPKGTSIKYTFEGALLRSVANVGGIVRYDYGPKDNLIRISFPDRTERRVTYDLLKDLATSVIAEQCTDKLTFKSTTTTYHEAEVEHSCHGSAPRFSQYKVWRTEPGESGKVTRVSFNTYGESWDREWDAKTGVLISHKTDKETRRFRYDPQLRVIGIDTAIRRLEFKYESASRRVTRADLFQPSAKNVKKFRNTVSYRYLYGTDEHPTAVVDKDGNKMAVTYDGAGRISSLKKPDRTLELKYKGSESSVSSIVETKPNNRHVASATDEATKWNLLKDWLKPLQLIEER
jgi:YD repeat-containing protein